MIHEQTCCDDFRLMALLTQRSVNKVLYFKNMSCWISPLKNRLVRYVLLLKTKNFKLVWRSSWKNKFEDTSKPSLNSDSDKDEK